MLYFFDSFIDTACQFPRLFVALGGGFGVAIIVAVLA